MSAKHALPIGVLGLTLGLALGACGDNNNRIPPDVPTSDPDAAAPPIDSPPPTPDARPDAAPDAPPDAPPDAFVPVNLASNPDIEVDTAGWTTNAGPTQPMLAVSMEQHHGGAASLLVTNRAGNWNGPAVDITMKIVRGRKYEAAVFARLVDPGTVTFKLSTRPVCSEEPDPRFNELTMQTGGVASDNQTWVETRSAFTVNDAANCTLTNYKVYVETSSGTMNFYLDDISIIEVTP
jgi:hypothetical protein